MIKSLTIPLFAIRHKQIGGTEFAIYNLIKGLALTPLETTLVFDCNDHLSPEFNAWLNANRAIIQKTALGFPGPKNIRFIQETVFEWSGVHGDWTLYPNYFVPPRGLRSRHHSAVILHDIQYKVLPEYHSSRRKAWLDRYLPWMFERADKVFLISQSEKKYVEQFFGAKAAEKCDVIYNAIDWDRFKEHPQIQQPARILELTSRPFILTVCHQFPHKNLQTLLKAFEQIALRQSDIQLYMVGVDSPSNSEFIASQLSPATRERVKLLGFLSDIDLGALYRAAELFVLPSLYEGFGMPAVEALGLGTPILVSGTTSLPEVTLGLGNYVDQPKDVDAWASQMTHLLSARNRHQPEAIDAIKAAYAPYSVATSLLAALKQRG